MSHSPSWQSTVIAVAFVALVGCIFLVVYSRDGIDAAMQAWGAVGTVVGVLTGAVPTYFFGRAANESLREQTQTLRDQTRDFQQSADVFRERASTAERKIEAIYDTDPDIVKQARAKYPHLFETREDSTHDDASGR
jgi:hypothetical protein